MADPQRSKKNKHYSNTSDDSKEEWVFAPMTLYEFTINLNDDNQVSRGREKNRHLKAKAVLEHCFDDTTIKYCLYPEVSMPQFGDKYHNTYPRIHYHGWIVFPTNKAVCDYLLETAIKLARIGRYQFNPARIDYWNKYIKKHQGLFKGTLKPVRNIGCTDIIRYSGMKCIKKVDKHESPEGDSKQCNIPKEVVKQTETLEDDGFNLSD